jgi:hypothetical protein
MDANVNNNSDILFSQATNDGDLQSRHNEMPVYIPLLRVALTIGHFVTVCCGERSFVGQIIRVDSRHHSDNPSHVNVVVNPYLPWNSQEIIDFCGSLRPCSITSASCRGCSELVQSILTASVSVENITGIAFLFLWEDLENLLYHVQGMSTAFVA